MNTKIIESQSIEVRLLDGAILKLRPLTLAERKECISKVPEQLMDLKNVSEDKFAEAYIDLQSELLYFIIHCSDKVFKKEDIYTKMDTSIIEQIILTVLRDPLSEIFKWT